MKTYNQFFAFYFFHANVLGTTAFSLKLSKGTFSTAIRSTAPKEWSDKESKATPSKEPGIKIALSSDLDMFPVFPNLKLTNGGGAVRTYKMPSWATKCQMIFKTGGRPLKAKVELLLGPIRVVHTLDMDLEDGSETPVQAILTFKQAAPVLRVTTSDSDELPVLSGVYVPQPDRIEELHANTEKVWDTCTKVQKQHIQGGSTAGGGGAIRYWTIPANIESVQILAWTRDVSEKGLYVNIEVLQGPNNIKQKYDLRCASGSQPYHAVFQTPGDGCVIRMTNKKYLEDGLVQMAVLPYEMIDDGPDPGGFL